MNSPGHFRPGATEAQRKLLLQKRRRRRFTEVGRQSGPGFAVGEGRPHAAAGDIDNDGDLDLLVTNNGAAVDLLRNDGRRRTCAPPAARRNRSNRDGIGARLRLTAGGRTQVREVKAGSSYLGQQDLRVHFGLGRATRIDRLEIRWPAGTTEIIADAAINQILTVTEGKGVTGRVPFVRAR